ncbi:hypothetical protein HDV04_005165 [Boothiomyces sp. JEL0838]|nr:hypothetical protein HDV04_005165 [Boothiomyces sp. JEL0838]
MNRNHSTFLLDRNDVGLNAIRQVGSISTKLDSQEKLDSTLLYTETVRIDSHLSYPSIDKIYTDRFKNKPLFQMLLTKNELQLNLMILLLYLNETDKELLRKLIKLIFQISVDVNNIMDMLEFKSIVISSLIKGNADLAASLYFEDQPLNIGTQFLENLPSFDSVNLASFTYNNDLDGQVISNAVRHLYKQQPQSNISNDALEILCKQKYFDKKHLKRKQHDKYPKYQYYMYKTFIHYYTEKDTNSLHHACFWYNQMIQHYKPDKTVLTRLIYLIGQNTKSKNFMYCLVYFIDEFLRYNLVPDHKVFAIMLNTYIKIKDYDKIERLIELIKENMIATDLGYLSMLLKYYVKVKDKRVVDTVIQIEKELEIDGLSGPLKDGYDTKSFEGIKSRVQELSLVDRNRFAWILSLLIMYKPVDYYIDLYNFLQLEFTIPFQISLLLAKDCKTATNNFTKIPQILYPIEMEKLVSKNDIYSFLRIYSTQPKDLNTLHLLLRIVRKNQLFIPFMINEIDKFPAPDLFTFTLLYEYDIQTSYAKARDKDLSVGGSSGI